MDAVKTMNARTLSALRPVGNALQLTRADAATANPLVSTLLDTSRHQVHWTRSGTAALALAIANARSTAATTRPEVILPAYGCPDLIAAAVFAQVTPVLVDIQPDSPQFDAEQLSDAITPDTVAIVSATLLGMRGDEMTLRDIIGGRPIALIEDSAQWFPRDAMQTFFGDMVVLSFGRGKPVNLLGGGALLTRAPLVEGLAPPSASTASGLLPVIKFIGKALAYNTLIHPLPFGILERLPFLDIGATRYHALESIDVMDATGLSLLGTNLARYCQRDITVRHRWADLVETLNTRFPGLMLVDLAKHNRVPTDYALLRYPVAVTDPTCRNRICDLLTAQGLGASIMYPAALADLPDIPLDACRIHGQSNARLFAQRFLTLPTHEAVTPAIVDQAGMTIARARPID